MGSASRLVVPLAVCLWGACQLSAVHPAVASGTGAFQVADTARPPVPEERFGHKTDTVAFPVTHVDADFIYYRTVAGVSFDSTATGLQVRAVLNRFNAEVVAGNLLGHYVVRFPDPGPDRRDFDRLLADMDKMPGVSLVYPLAYWQAIRFSDDTAGVRPATHWNMAHPSMVLDTDSDDARVSYREVTNAQPPPAM